MTSEARVTWLGETRGTRFELVRHFLRRMLDGEWSSGPGQWQPVAVGAFAFLLAALYSGSIGDLGSKAIARLPQFGAWLPPVWFAGLHEYLLGDRDQFFASMAGRAVTSVLAAVGMTAITYLISYRRYRKLLVEAPVWAPARRSHRWSLLGLVAGEAQREAIMRFMATTLARSRSHRMIWLAYIGATVAVMLNSSIIDGAVFSKSGGLRPALQFAAVFWPVGASVILLNGFRHVVSIPAELPANWIFQITENQGRKFWMSAVERFVVLYVIAPIHLLLAPVTVQVFGWAVALRMTTLQVLVSLTLFELLFYSWQQLPFTCSFVPGKKPLAGLLAKYMALLTVFVPLVSMIITAVSQYFEVFLGYGPFFAGIWWFFRHRRREGWGEAKILYEELPRVVASLGLRG